MKDSTNPCKIIRKSSSITDSRRSHHHPGIISRKHTE